MLKLVEVTMTDGTFEVGETVGGLMPSSLTESSTTADNSVQPALLYSELATLFTNLVHIMNRVMYLIGTHMIEITYFQPITQKLPQF